MEATAAHYSPRLGFLKRNLWPRTHFKHLPLHSSPTGICNKFQNKMDGKNQQLHSISLVRKRTSSAVSNPHWTQFFLRCGPEWVILIYSNMGFAYSSLFYMFFIVLPEKKKKKVSYPLLVLQLLAWYFLNHYLFWHTSDFSWKMGSRVCCTLKGHIHLERRKEEDICMRVRNHSDPSLSAPVINMLQNRRHLLNFVVNNCQGTQLQGCIVRDQCTLTMFVRTQHCCHHCCHHARCGSGGRKFRVWGQFSDCCCS